MAPVAIRTTLNQAHGPRIWTQASALKTSPIVMRVMRSVLPILSFIQVPLGSVFPGSPG